MGKRIAIIGAIKDEIAGIKNQMRIDDTLRWQTGNAFAGEWAGLSIILVVISPDSMPNVSCSTLATGARQFVVQLAFDTHFISGDSLSSLTPRTTVKSAPSLAGALSTTFLAPA